MADQPVTCPKCGHENPSGAADCDNCGITFNIYDMERERAKTIEDTRDLTKGEGGAKNDGLTGCPSCGQPTDLSSQDCLSCGIVFAKYFEIQERSLADDTEKLAELQRIKQIHLDAVAVRKAQEERERAAAKKREEEERARAEALRKQRAEQEEAERRKREQEEKKRREKAEALEREKEKKRQEEEKALAEAKAKQEGKQQQLKAEQLQTAEGEKEKALRQQREAFEREQQQRQEELAKERERALQEQKAQFEKEEEEREKAAKAELAAVLEKQREDLEANRSMADERGLAEQLPSKPRIVDLLKRYEGQTIRINIEKPDKLALGVLLNVNVDHLRVFDAGSDTLFIVPLSGIASLSEHAEGVNVKIKGVEKTIFLTLLYHHP
ncbi:MAG: zinc ribbon domain-containing protein [Desulfobacteraceae bacterium]|nr:zinc ribbon domain-containing protein [Desulfobacteraceae bacterium]